MLTQLEVFSVGITTPPLPIGDGSPATDPIRILDIDGLNPVKASVNTMQYGSIDGEFYNGSSVGKRNIVLTIGLNPNWSTLSYEDLRKILYLYFMPKSDVRLRFTSTHMATVEISGIVESCDPDIFSKDPEFQVSIICPQPYFKAIAASAVSGMTVGLADTTKTDINYPGDVPVGFVIDVSSVSGGPVVSSGEIRFVNTTPSTQFFSVSGAIDGSKFIRVSTVQGNKYAQQVPLPSGFPSNLIGSVAPGSSWWSLQKGINKVQVQTPNPGQAWSLSYFAFYGGL